MRRMDRRAGRMDAYVGYDLRWILIWGEGGCFAGDGVRDTSFLVSAGSRVVHRYPSISDLSRGTRKGQGGRIVCYYLYTSVDFP